MSDYPGVRKRITMTCRNELTNQLADPTTLEVSYRRIGDTVTTKTWPADAAVVVRDSVGVFHIDVDSDREGTWALRADADGAIVTASETTWPVERSNFVS